MFVFSATKCARPNYPSQTPGARLAPPLLRISLPGSHGISTVDSPLCRLKNAALTRA